MEIFEEIKMEANKQGVIFQHIFREGNQLAGYFANLATHTDRILEFNSFTDIPGEGRRILNTDKYQIPAIRISTRKIKPQNDINCQTELQQ